MSGRLGLILGLTLSAAACSPKPAPAPEPPAVTAESRTTEVIIVRSKDNTPIAVECAGEGLTLLMVHGGVGDRSRWTPLIPLFSKDMRACAMDRRGRGGSGDAAEYNLQKEAEDVAAVVASFPGEVSVMGHSFGGVAAYEAAFLTRQVSRLILYEAPFKDPVDRNLAAAAKVEKLISEGKPEDALILFQTEVVGQPADEIAAMKSRPSWSVLVESIKVHPRQMRALAAYRFDPARAAGMTVPTLYVLGGASSSPQYREAAEALDAALPNSRIVELEGQGHNAMEAGRNVLAEQIRQFVATPLGTHH
jgi:pimeloyl-ACP methyl ester carboxylesterase